MLVQRVVAPMSGAVSWTVVDEHFDPVGPADAYLAHLDAIERSPNAVRAYASSLRLWFEHLAGRGIAWDSVVLDEIGRFVSWLRTPAEGVIVIDAGAAGRAVATVNRHLAAVFGLYDFHARRGVRVATELVDWRRGGRGSYKPFLDGVGGRSRRAPRRPVRLRPTRRLPETLTTEQVAAVLGACEHLRVSAVKSRCRDRFLLALLAETGMRIGQALGLRHADVVSREVTRESPGHFGDMSRPSRPLSSTGPRATGADKGRAPPVPLHLDQLATSLPHRHPHRCRAHRRDDDQDRPQRPGLYDPNWYPTARRSATPTSPPSP